jgi:type IV pilus assembly protein PilB
MGIEPYLVASAVRLVIAQRLVRKICESCLTEVTLSEADCTMLPKDIVSAIKRVFRGTGCSHCNGIGYHGRTPVFEVMQTASPEMKRLITEGGTEVAVAKVARAEGFQTLKESAIELVSTGQTTVEEAMGILLGQ